MVITLSRQAESGGDEIAEAIAAATGLRIADRVILEQMAHRASLPVSHLELYDETVPGAIEALVAEWQTSVNQVRVHAPSRAHAIAAGARGQRHHRGPRRRLRADQSPERCTSA